MEKWKILVIIGLLSSLAVFGVMQNKPATAPESVPSGTAGPAPVVTPNPQLAKMIGARPLPWNIPAANWKNTPKPVTLNDLKGQVAVIEFWRFQCSHCQQAVPFLSQLYNQYKGRVKFVTFQSPGPLTADNPETSWKSVQEFIKVTNIPYPVAFDEGRKLKDQYTKTFGVDRYPFTIVLDKKGDIRHAETGFDSEKGRMLVQELEKLLKE
jgi:thiol-disulfide isomerase/thioredoxin